MEGTRPRRKAQFLVRLQFGEILGAEAVHISDFST